MELKKIADFGYITECGNYMIVREPDLGGSTPMWGIVEKPSNVMFMHEDFETTRDKLEEIMSVGSRYGTQESK